MSSRRDVADQRLPAAQYETSFADVKPPLTAHQAVVESDRCYFCFDAPCVEACPTHIDIPSFIHKIRSGNLAGSARNIMEENIFGGVCGRVCPVEILCEGACVRNTAEDKPVTIGLLQRHATDALMASGTQLFERAAPTGHRVAVVGAGPAGLACAHRLAMLGHDVVVHEARPDVGGLNEYGLADYKVKDDIARREAEYLLAIGGIEVRTNVRVGADVTLAALRRDYDAVFLGFGLGGVHALGLEGEDVPGVDDAVRYIERLRQASDLSTLPVGRRIAVIGGGLTAIDIASQSHRLGADEVTMFYRRGPEDIGATDYERTLARADGVTIRYWSQPRRLLLTDGEVTGIEIERTEYVDGELRGTGVTQVHATDMVFKAIGQKLVLDALDEATAAILETCKGRIVVDANGRTSVAGIWAGGDCTGVDRDLTVAAVQAGKVAAQDMHRALNADAVAGGRDAAAAPVAARLNR